MEKELLRKAFEAGKELGRYNASEIAHEDEKPKYTCFEEWYDTLVLPQADVKLSLPEQYKEGAKWGYSEGFKAALKSLNDMLPIIESKMNEGNGA